MSQDNTHQHSIHDYRLTLLIFLALTIFTINAALVSSAGEITITNAYPNNKDATYNPRLSVNVNDALGRSLTVVFETNATGNWTEIGRKAGGNGVYIQHTNNSGMNVKNQVYYWRARATVTGDSTYSTYKFTAKPFVWKWSYNTGVNSTVGPLAADVTGDGIYEVFLSGEDKITCLNGATGALVWEYVNTRIMSHAPFELGDLNNDGILEVVLPAGENTVALHANNGSVYWSVPVRSQDKGVLIADIEGNGYPYVYTASEDVENGENGIGRLRKLNGTNGKVLDEVFTWRPCWGGLSIADANNDGKFELYMGDRSVYYHPPSLGKGVQAYDADTLDLLWYHDEILCSSHIPALIDVKDKNGVLDGILDAVVMDQSGTGAYVVDGSTEEFMPGRYDNNTGKLTSHSQFSIWDVDGDGNLELATVRAGSQAKVFDLSTWNLDATLDPFDEPPKMADVIGDSQLEIIGADDTVIIYNATSPIIRTDNITTTLPNGTNITTTISYPSYQTMETIKQKAMASTLVQDIDNDDQNELILISYTGNVQVYDTSAYAPTPRVRTTELYYSERRLGAGVYIPPPGAPQAFIKEETPADGSIDMNLNPQLTIHAVDFRYDLMDIEFSTNASGTWETIASFNNSKNGFYSVTPKTMRKYDTTYSWKVTARDAGGDNITTTKIYSFTTKAAPPWPMPGWNSRKMITINRTKVAGDVTDFPVLIDITDPNLADYAQQDGKDILFTTDDETSVLKYEIESYDSATGHLVAWVKVPYLSSSADVILYMYYDNPTTESLQNPKGVWDADYLAVHHLEEATGVVTDSTSIGNDGNPLGLTQDVAGKIDGAGQFDGVDDRVVLPRVFSSESQFTFEAWVNTPNKQGYIIFQRDNLSQGAFLQYYPSTFQLLLNNNQKLVRSASPNTWHYVVATFDGSTSTARLYIDAGTPTQLAGSSVTWPTDNVIIGDRNTLGRAFTGMLDEIRLSKTARSEAYIKTSFNNQNNPSAFITLGLEEIGPSNISSNISCVDNDADGYNVTNATGEVCGPIDCNDNDPLIHPNATELCNNVDDDCDASTLDGSGEIAALNSNQVGVCAGSLQSCTLGVWTEDYTTIPSYEEPELSCDGLDNNCDGQVDENVKTTYYLDADLDSYGDSLVSLQDCVAPAGYVIDSTDCDDTNPAIHPGAIELCNGIDDDCNGLVDDGCQDWTYRKMITIDHTKVTGDLTNFPVLIDLTDSDLVTYAQPNGDDILFRAEDGTTKLSHEIESYESGTGKLTAWVKIPSLSSTQDTIIYLYYGNQNVGNQEEPEDVWDSNYLAVQHMEESSGIVEDSTSNNNDGNPLNGVLQGVSGKIDGASQFDGVDDRIVLPRVFTTENQFTFEVWVNSANKQGYIMSQRDTQSRGPFLQYYPTTFQLYLNNNQQSVRSATPNVWHYVVGTYDGSTARLYVDQRIPVSVVGIVSWPGQGLIIGDRSTLGRAFQGTLDELRLSSTVRSEAYISTSYNNQVNPAAFAVVGATELLSSEPKALLQLTGMSVLDSDAPECITDNDCIAYNLPKIAECGYIPLEGTTDTYDTDPYTWDYREEWVSHCIDGACTIGREELIHTCDVTQCHAECDATNPCIDGKTCLSSCTCG